MGFDLIMRPDVLNGLAVVVAVSCLLHLTVKVFFIILLGAMESSGIRYGGLLHFCMKAASVAAVVISVLAAIFVARNITG
ncbi:hypothetical protein [Intestinibacillus massiliensis]|uniref:hypothetical protein n=1 Tax=Intestinibacillus massiliensis TaxID=1871029 RepID=UPI000B355D98|nr:hypothetical protein [Intestinibacillus massiliensis]